MSLSLQNKLRLIIAPVVLASALLPTAWSIYQADAVLVRQASQSLAYGAMELRRDLQHHYRLLSLSNLQHVPEFVAGSQEAVFRDGQFKTPVLQSDVVVVADDGSLRFSSAGSDLDYRFLLERHGRGAIERPDQGCDLGRSDSSRGLFYCSAYFEPWGLHLYQLADARMLTRPLDALWADSALLVALVLALSYFVLFRFLDRFVTSRIRRVTLAMEQVSSDNLECVARIRGRDEVARIGESFNTMLARLRDSIASKEELDREIVQRRQVERDLETQVRNLQATETELRGARAAQDQLIARMAGMQRALINQEKLAGIGLLAAGVAHEMNTPMAFVGTNIRVLKGYVEELLKILSDCLQQAAPGSATTVPDTVAEIRADLPALIAETEDGIARVRSIVQGLRTYSRQDPGVKAALDVHECLTAALNLVRNEIKYHCRVITDYRAVQAVLANEQQITQVFVNLLMNAAQSSAQECEIRISTLDIQDGVLITVEDNGCGMSEAVVNRLFEPFFTTKPVGQGTGLGLPIAHGIVQEHGGTIEVDSTPGAGSRFTVELPTAETSAKPARQPECMS